MIVERNYMFVSPFFQSLSYMMIKWMRMYLKMNMASLMKWWIALLLRYIYKTENMIWMAELLKNELMRVEMRIMILMEEEKNLFVRIMDRSRVYCLSWIVVEFVL